MSRSAQDPIQTLTSAIVACGSTLVREATQLFRPVGLTVPHFDVLELLVRADSGLRPSELAGSLVVDPSSTTYLIDQLEKRGWISREDEAGDRRAYRVLITPAGRAMHQKASLVYRAALKGLSERLSGRDLLAVAQFLTHIQSIAADAAADAAQASPTAPAARRKPSRKASER